VKQAVSIAQLKARLSEYIRHVKSGHEVVITDRGAAVARLVPLDPSERRATRRDRLARSGVIKSGRGRLRKELESPPAGDPIGSDVLAYLLAERHDERAR
jgi:prevent-host-death family protein